MVCLLFFFVQKISSSISLYARVIWRIMLIGLFSAADYNPASGSFKYKDL
jgi:uncharacterized protein YqhQ